MVDKITFEQVDLSFELTKIFDNLTLELLAGKIIAITGANGSGKSTFLKLAGQFIRPDKGKVISYESGKLLILKNLEKRFPPYRQILIFILN